MRVKAEPINHKHASMALAKHRPKNRDCDANPAANALALRNQKSWNGRLKNVNNSFLFYMFHYVKLIFLQNLLQRNKK